jgi:DNA repair exonuclease SbcCD ATPase subunit
MAKAKCTIRKVTIEGFRGFTERQTIPVEGKHLFLFGPNGRGKSSVIEAIRWCLFGSPPDKMEIEVRNTFYPHGECNVVLDLEGPSGSLQMRRDLRPGAMRASEPTITDAAGNKLLLREAFPQLARIGHHEGTQVIFATQQETGRPPTNISDFSKVLYFYLHVEEIPELLEVLRDLIEERNAQREELAKRIETIEAGYRQQIESVEGQLDEIARNPPWGEGTSPTYSETEAKVDASLREMASLAGDEVLTGLSIADRLAKIGEWSRNVVQKQSQELTESLVAQQASARDLRTILVELQATECTRQEVEVRLRQAETDLAALLAGESLDELRAKLADLENALTDTNARLDIVTRAKAICAGSAVIRCPVCGVEHEAWALAANIDAEIRRCAPEGDVGLRAIQAARERLVKADALHKSIETASSSVAFLLEKETGTRSRLGVLLATEPMAVTTPLAESRVQELDRAIASITAQIADADSERKRREKVTKDLEAELRYHDHRDKVQTLRELLTSGLDEARSSLSQYQELLTTIEHVRQLIEIAFGAAIDRALPPLNNLLTDVYRRLTGQVSYNSVCVKRCVEPQPKLELRVSSERRPGQDFPVSVLNGQASKALQLVPYFVFSKFQPEVMELDLLLIDDPSQCFDTSHVDTLMNELGEAASHAQLFIATHEKDRFEPLLDRHFARDAYAVVSVEDFDPLKGPKLDHR